jgi:hypothetical protein
LLDESTHVARPVAARCRPRSAIRPFLVSLSAGLALGAGAASAAPTTTEPGKALLVYVSIRDSGITTSFWTSTTVSGQETKFVLQPGQVTRGQMAYFVVQNFGKKPHDFVLLGRKTRKLRPGAKAHFHLVLARRGEFPYRSTLDDDKAFRGIFRVF